MMPFMPVAAVLLALQSAQPPQYSPTATPSATTAVAQRASTAPVIDGKDNDDVWRVAPVIKDFRPSAPPEVSVPPRRTEARIAYDAGSLSFFGRASDDHPDSKKKRRARRDV